MNDKITEMELQGFEVVDASYDNDGMPNGVTMYNEDIDKYVQVIEVIEIIG